MRKLLVGNAPCSWGTLEFEELRGSGEPIAYGRMLDELVQAGYTGTELGDWGYMPTDPAALSAELGNRGVTMLGAFVPVALKYSECHSDGIANAVKTAHLLASVATSPAPYLVLADANGTDAQRTRLAGRITQASALSLEQWKVFAAGADRLAHVVFEETGIKTVFHHHCAGYVETPAEIATLLELTNPERLGLVFDAGHYCYGAGTSDCDVAAGFDQFAERVWYVHLKDCQPTIAQRARNLEWDYFTALRYGVFCELGQGCIDFPGLLHRLSSKGYDGYMLVEQDILPGMGTPQDSARRNRDYLRSIEANFLAPLSERV
jgi:inosose dehydratase